MPASVSEYAARCPRVASSRVSRPAATSRLSRLLRMLDALSFEHGAARGSGASRRRSRRAAALIGTPTSAADENLRSPWSVSPEPIAKRNHQSRSARMSLTRIQNLSISLDGFATGEPQSADAPFGHAGERLHEWMFGTRFWDAGGTAGVDDAFAERHSYGIGAEIMGANKFGPPGWRDDPDWKGWWGPNPPFHTPTFVLTHRPRPSIEMEGGTTFHFLDAAPAEALETAREAADGQDVRIGGGPTVVRDFLAAGLVVHMHLVQVPIVLGRGVRIWDGLEALEDAYNIEAVSSPSGVTHLTFTRKVVS